MTCGAPAPPTLVEANKTLHSTVPKLVKSFALPTDVSCTDVTRFSAAQMLSSALHRAVFSAIAGEATNDASATRTASTARASVEARRQTVIRDQRSPITQADHPRYWPFGQYGGMNKKMQVIKSRIRVFTRRRSFTASKHGTYGQQALLSQATSLTSKLGMTMALAPPSSARMRVT